MIAQGDAQLGTILGLKRQLAQASPATLAMVRAEIATCVATASYVARQAEASTSAGTSTTPSLAAASQAARQAVNEFEDAYFKERKFDPYLQFKSEEEERAYREREAERLAELEKAKARHTPEGDVEALRLSKAQLLDAGAHGADRSPDYAPAWEKLDRAERDLSEAKTREVPAAKQASPRDPLDDVAPSQDVSPAIIAHLRAAGVTIPGDVAEGHGLAAEANRGSAEGRRV